MRDSEAMRHDSASEPHPQSVHVLYSLPDDDTLARHLWARGQLQRSSSSGPAPDTRHRENAQRRCEEIAWLRGSVASLAVGSRPRAAGRRAQRPCDECPLPGHDETDLECSSSSGAAEVQSDGANVSAGGAAPRRPTAPRTERTRYESATAEIHGDSLAVLEERAAQELGAGRA